MTSRPEAHAPHGTQHVVSSLGSCSPEGQRRWLVCIAYPSHRQTRTNSSRTVSSSEHSTTWPAGIIHDKTNRQGLHSMVWASASGTRGKAKSLGAAVKFSTEAKGYTRGEARSVPLHEGRAQQKRLGGRQIHSRCGIVHTHATSCLHHSQQTSRQKQVCLCDTECMARTPTRT